MIEFAPNPSGAAHIGTLRTYATAWLLAQQRREQLFVRFDAHNLVPCSPRDPKWAWAFLDELKQLQLSPDGWDYLDAPRKIGGIPEWADVREIPWGHDDNGVPIADGPLTLVAYYPDDPPVLCLPSMEPKDYRAGHPDPVVMYEESPCWYYFAVRNHEMWCLDESLVSLMDMHFRGTTAIVRSSLSVFLHDYLELPAAKYFGYRVPETVRVDVVCDDKGALSKHRQRCNTPGTIRYSIEKIGAAKLRDRVLASAEMPAQGMPLRWQQVVGHD